MEPNEVIPE